MNWMNSADKARKIFEQPVNKALGALAGVFSEAESLDADEMRVLALLKALLPSNPAAMEKALLRLREKLEVQGADSRKIREIMRFMSSAAPGSAEEALPVMKRYPRIRQTEVLSNFLLLAVERGEYRTEALETIRKIALELEFTLEEFEEIAQNVLASCTQRTKFLKSSTGIILALIVIALFILTATWLSSLLFGMALAYIFLPLEQSLERRFFPQEKVNRKLGKKSRYELSEEELARRAQQARTNKATYLTVGIVVCGGLFICVGLGLLAAGYLGTLHHDLESWMQKQRLTAATQTLAVYQSEIPADKTASAAIPNEATVPNVSDGTALPAGPAYQTVPPKIQQINESLAGYIIRLRERFQELPAVEGMLTEASAYFANDEARRSLWSLMLKKSGGLFAFLAKFIAGFAGFLLNLLLTFFFFSLLLNQLAIYVNSAGNAGKRSTSYLVRTIFNGRWLPAVSEEDLANGDRIIGESINKLRVWLRGYLTMVLIDMCVYTLVFWWLGVPYFGILGIIAGLGILLPYIGPVSSALLTILVTLIAGEASASVTQIVGIVLTYLIYNGIFEQFFSYPYFIGDKLGLTTLETIIVVLLGGIMAGIPGMIFALPAAAVLKYIVPQIYRCWK